ncbi:hypothetical protein RhoFasSB10_03848 [Rhodococcus fascians]|uniref:MBL fold metallo-hydrolase n=1 Tax=Nocardiaceae TaxID=85025 RepID=UPI001427E987|nr:MBL fold metallo-hydrolase [Rhodococcus sp. 06-221-2]NIL85889.1 hypothetical protein [Rhodococcus fascians]NIL91502.1 hypothetical protein [Rhodococcus fascians]
MQIGSIRIDGVRDGEIRMDPTFVYPTRTMDDWQPYLHHLDGGEYVNSIGGYLVRTGSAVILADVGVGVDPPAPFTGGDFLDELAALGVAPADVTHVVFTHLHFDHIGWAVKDDRRVFEQAKYFSHEADWSYFFSDHYRGVRIEREQDRPSTQLAPLADSVNRWDGNQLELVPGVVLRHAPGHTPGSTIVELVSDGERGLLLGDLAHNPVELIDSSWPGVADCGHDEARSSAARVADDLIATGTPFALAHSPGFRWARLVEGHDGRRDVVPVQ